MKQQPVVIFGGSGFLGHYVAREVARTGRPIKIVSRHPGRADDVKPSGTVGQIVTVPGNITSKESVQKLVKGAYAVINLVGILFEKKPQTFSALHAQGPENLAKAAQEAGVSKFIHISALGADAHTKSLYARTKLTGEKAVRAAFPAATIFRPSIMFGAEDSFFNRFAQFTSFSPMLPLIGGGDTRMQPVYVADVARAIVYALEHSDCEGKTYELGGPHTYSFKELMEYLLTQIKRERLLMPIPFSFAMLEAAFLEHLPKPPLTRDQVQMLKVDNVVHDDALTFDDLNISPTALEAIVPGYLARYAG
ncbi:MAG: NAD-dependent epimerase/dehydratase [Rickettsiales bacterium]|jgi:NADH dehydrogenase|nr:NAD-dependent epimerase/dehydratase [Rickettsiales bacterium]